MTNQAFDKHLKQIKEILKKEKVVLKFKKKSPIGIYDYVADVIEINVRLKNEYKILALLHEMGHHIDKKVNKATFSEEYSIPIEWMNSTMFNNIYKSEIRAWDNAAKLLKQLNIKINSKIAKSFRNEALQTYKALLDLKHAEDVFTKQAKRYFK